MSRWQGPGTRYRRGPRNRTGRRRSTTGEESMIRVVTFGLTGLLVATLTASAQTPVERGSYLVNGVLTCGNCHTPRGPGGVFAMDRQLSGGPQEWDTPTFKVKGANITLDKETGIGNWSEADIKIGRASCREKGRRTRGQV